MKRRHFTAIAISTALTSTLSSCKSPISQLAGKWEVISDTSDTTGSFIEISSDGVFTSSVPKFKVLALYDYRLIEGDRLSLRSQKTGETEVFAFRFDRGYLYLRSDKNSQELKYKRV